MKLSLMLLVLFYSSMFFAQQETFEDEIIIHLLNYNISIVTATADRLIDQGAKWYPPVQPNPYTLINDDEFDIVNSNNVNDFGLRVNRIVYDLEGDQNYDTDKTLAVGFYRLTFSNKSSSVYINTVSKDMDDVHMTFDYANDNLYWGECTSCTNEITNTDIFYTFDTQNTVGIEDYWENGLYAALENYHPAKVVWNKYYTYNTIQKYIVYKAITPYSTAPNESEFEWLTELPSSLFTFQDMHTHVNNGDQYAYFFVKAYYYNGSSYVWSDKTNVVFWQTQYNWQNTLNIGRSDTHPRIVWWPYPASGYSVDSYKIYRSVTSPTVPPQSPSYSLLTTVGSNQFSYNDEDYSSGNQILHYYVTANLVPLQDGSPVESEASNVVVTTGGLYKQVAETT